jgi:hypothetical protein
MAKKPKEPKIPKRLLRIVERCRGGETLCREPGPRGGEPRFWFEPSQENAPAVSCHEAIQAGLLVGNGDGLLPGTSQTFRAA